MIAVQPSQSGTHRYAITIMWASVALALVAALSYFLIALNVLAVGDLAQAEAPAAIPYVCAGCYVLGGLLILLRWRWLWIVGAVINAIVMLFFFQAYSVRPSVMFSPGGLLTKGAQLLLELGLLYLIITAGRRSHAATA